MNIKMRSFASLRTVTGCFFLLIFAFAANAQAASISSYGAACDGVTDDIQAFNAAWQDMANGQISALEISGKCHLSQPWVLQSNEKTYKPKLISGWGAELDNTVVVSASSVSIKGLSVINAPKDGFAFLRGQGSSHERLHAEGNGRHGFYFGTDNGGYGKNSQVTNVVFNLLSSIANSQDGFHWDGRAGVNRSWLNANTFIQPVARDNIGRSWNTVPGTGATGLVSRINYNTLIGAQFEGNGGIPDFTTTRSFTFVGTHIADLNSAGESLIPGDISYILGGRIRGDIRDKTTNNSILVNTSAAGEGGRIHYLHFMDQID